MRAVPWPLVDPRAVEAPAGQVQPEPDPDEGLRSVPTGLTWLRVLPSGTRQHDPNVVRPGCSSGTRKPPRPRGPQARAFGNQRKSVPTDSQAPGQCFLSPLLYKRRVNFPEPQRTLTPGHRVFRLPPGRTPRGRPRRALAARHARPFMKTPAPHEAFGNIHETTSSPARVGRSDASPADPGRLSGEVNRTLDGRRGGGLRPRPERGSRQSAPRRSLQVCSEAETRVITRPRQCAHPADGRRPCRPRRAINPRPAVDPITGT